MRPSGQGPCPLSWLIWPLSPASRNSEPHPEAISSAFSQGGIGGLILGAVYVKAKNNLLACIVVHALINTLPGMVMIKFGSH